MDRFPAMWFIPYGKLERQLSFIMAGAARENCRSIGRRSWPFMGIQFFIPDAVNHGERHALSDYYTSEGYDIFWKTIFSNVEEFPFFI